MRGHKWKRHIIEYLDTISGYPVSYCTIRPFNDSEATHFISPESISSYFDYPEGFCKTCVKRYEQFKKEGKI